MEGLRDIAIQDKNDIRGFTALSGLSISRVGLWKDNAIAEVVDRRSVETDFEAKLDKKLNRRP